MLRGRMELEILPRQETVPDWDPAAVRVRRIQYYPGEIYTEEEINEALIADLLKDTAVFLEATLYLSPDGGGDWMEVLSDGEWAALTFVSEKWQVIYYSYNPAMDGILEYTPLRSEGNIRVEACFALRICIHNRGMPDGRGFFSPDKEIFRGNPDGLQGESTQYGGKKTAQTACNGCEYRF